MAGQNEIVACIAQHNQRFDQIHNSLGLMELDLDSIKMKGNDTLLLVKQLANAVNARGDGSAAIYIRVPRALYDPALSMWNGVSLLSHTLRIRWLIYAVPSICRERKTNIYSWWLGSGTIRSCLRSTTWEILWQRCKGGVPGCDITNTPYRPRTRDLDTKLGGTYLVNARLSGSLR
jgi:hypothetical protein